MAKEVVLTPEGRQQLIDELEYLENEKRAEVGERIKVAREFGDLSENSEYDDAKNEQAFVESRIAEISNILANATVTEVSKRSNKVNIGTSLTLEGPKGELNVTIVGTAEANPAQGRISNESPVGSAVIGKKKGDKVQVVTPSGNTIEYVITKLSNK
ncbi:MAG: transcription elongation factor GreA [Coriobacteriia bacterium]|nr:transcription elongation factor GreA [Coriobacteriia bacterium]